MLLIKSRRRQAAAEVEHRAHRQNRLCRFARALCLISLLLAASGAQCLNGVFFPPSSALTITTTPVGCGKKASSTETFNWSIKFTVAGAPAGFVPQWFFSDGTSLTGTSVIKTFDTNNQAVAGDPTPIKFNVTVMAGTESKTQGIGVPMRGIPDGIDPFGDSCIADEGRTHVPVGNTVCYTMNPPASGNHYSQSGVAPVSPGFFDEAVPTERWVHNLEHGTIVLLYDCGGTCSEDLKDQLRTLFDSVPVEPIFGQKKMVITRYAGIGASCPGTSSFPASGPFLAIAWDVQRPFATLDTTGILEFYARNVNHGPEIEAIPP